MPLFIPIAIVGASALLGGTGIKKGADGIGKITKARRMVDEGYGPYETAYNAALAQHELTLDTLSRYGRLKFDIYDNDLRAFMRAWNRLGAGDLSSLAQDPELDALIDALEHEAIDFELLDAARSILAGGGTAAASWAAAWGAVGSFGVASTGTALSGLSGVALSNGILAWFGGGSLAAGGLGVGVGAGVFASFVAGPAIAVTGLMINAKGNEALDQAREHVATLKVATAEAEAGHATDAYLDELAGAYTQTACEMSQLLVGQLPAVKQIASRGDRLHELNDEERDTVMQAANTAKVLKAVLDTPLVDAETRQPNLEAAERLREMRDRLAI